MKVQIASFRLWMPVEVRVQRVCVPSCSLLSLSAGSKTQWKMLQKSTETAPKM